jgi:cap1 methyltransferase
MNAKRRRPDPESTASSIHEAHRDYFDEVLGRHDGGLPPVISSWLRNVEWIGMAQPEGQAAISEELKLEIQVLSKQLIQVKRRLGSAAERSAEASHEDRKTSSQEFVEARRACNPYEVLGEGQSGGLNALFMNRSAIKLANVDAMIGFCLTRSHGSGPFLFADLCGAPGGFSEYIISRYIASGMPSCRGYGMSLVGSNEYGCGLRWKLEDFAHSGCGSEVHYKVCLGADGTGDIFHWDNVESLQTLIARDAPNKSAENDNHPGKVHLVLVDGGFDAQRDAEDQEGVTQKLVVCEVAAALGLLRQGGTLVVKLFGFQTPVVRSVLRYLFHSFDNLTAVKPISSRPASAERYLVCVGFKGCPQGWNGPRWRDLMFLGYVGAKERESDDAVNGFEGKMLLLEHYLSVFDRDLLSLNLKACYAVLSYLEAKGMNGGNAYFHATSTGNSVDVESYKYLWNLI